MSRYLHRVALITGAAQGLGHALAVRLAQEGAILAICDINPEIKQAAMDIVAGDVTRVVAPTVVDVADPAQVNAWVSDTVATFGRVDVLVNNAGIIRDSRLEHMTDDDWQTVIDVSLRGTFHCCRAVFPHMKHQQYGRILSLSSMSWRGNFGQANYTAAKAGIVGIARTTALEGAPFGITSNVIAPGLIDTPMLASMNEAARNKLTDRIPSKRIGHPTDIAEAAAYLCSEPARYVTGVVLDVDGGISIGSTLK
jgi:3-oxoacyl-[acyl-carrier protein] reductase